MIPRVPTAIGAALTLILSGSGAFAVENPTGDQATATTGRPLTAVSYRTVELDGTEIFYREAGSPQAPALLLLHGFPSSSFMFRNLIPALAERYRVIAPDYPGFGYSAFPDPELFRYSFAHYGELMEKFTRAVGLERYALYMQDYGAPVGLRLARRAPERVTALVIQNGNAYKEGLSGETGPLQDFWRDPSPANRETIRGWFNPAGIRLQYAAGLPEPQIERLSPDPWHLDWARISRPGNIEVQVDLLYDYRNNVAQYPQYQEYLREHRPPTLIAWGRYDPFFTVAGARAYLRDLPDAELHLLDAGHFALETHAVEIAALIEGFLQRRLEEEKQQ